MLADFCRKGVWKQRGDGERRINRVVNMMKKMMQDQTVLNEYWVEAMNTTIYLLNNSPNKVVNHDRSYI
jgi:hypothetical protein